MEFMKSIIAAMAGHFSSLPFTPRGKNRIVLATGGILNISFPRFANGPITISDPEDVSAQVIECPSQFTPTILENFRAFLDGDARKLMFETGNVAWRLERLNGDIVLSARSSRWLLLQDAAEEAIFAARFRHVLRAFDRAAV